MKEQSSDSDTSYEFIIACEELTCSKQYFKCNCYTCTTNKKNSHSLDDITNQRVFVSKNNIPHIHGTCPSGGTVTNIGHITAVQDKLEFQFALA